MNEIFYTDERLKSDAAYQEFLRENPGVGYLKVRASAANEAVPISGIQIKVSKLIGTNNVVFFRGETDYSGMINDIVLPAPKEVVSDEVIPKFTSYDLTAKGSIQNIDDRYTISVCCGITVIQYINVTPLIYAEIG